MILSAGPGRAITNWIASHSCSAYAISQQVKLASTAWCYSRSRCTRFSLAAKKSHLGHDMSAPSARVQMKISQCGNLNSICGSGTATAALRCQ